MFFKKQVISAMNFRALMKFAGKNGKYLAEHVSFCLACGFVLLTFCSSIHKAVILFYYFWKYIFFSARLSTYLHTYTHTSFQKFHFTAWRCKNCKSISGHNCTYEPIIKRPSSLCEALTSMNSWLCFCFCLPVVGATPLNSGINFYFFYFFWNFAFLKMKRL